MGAEKDYSRLGLFVVIGLIVVLSTALFFLQRIRDRPVALATTYTEESISGLNIASMVRFKGVPVGRVDGIRIDADDNLVEINFELFLDRLADLGADVEEVQRASDIGVISDMRVSVIGNPVTGEAHLLIDTPADPPPPLTLSFEPDRLYIPYVRGLFTEITSQLPSLIARGEALFTKVEAAMDRLPETLDRTDQFLASADRVLQESDIPALSEEARLFFAATSEHAARLSEQFDRLAGDDGELTKLLATMEAVDLPENAASALNQTSLALEDLRVSLPAIRESLEYLRSLARLLEQQPEALVHGKRR
jgi:ABC-type transporter Mla subunit MlaD